MITNFILQNKIDKTILINTELYRLRKLGIIKKENISSFTKNIAFISGLFINIIKEILSKIIYFSIIYIIINKICGYNTNIFINTLFFLSIFGSLINNKILKNSKSKYHSVILLNMNCKDYIIIELISNLVLSFIFSFTSLLLLSNILNITIFLNILLSLFIVLIKILGETLNLIYYKTRKKLFLNNIPLYFSILILIIILIFITCKFNYNITTNTLIITNIILTITSIPSLIFIFNIKDYKKIYKRIINFNSYTFSDGSTMTKDEDYSINNEYNKKISNKYNNPYKYFNKLFITRHKRVLLRPIILDIILLFIIGITITIGVIYSKQVNITTKEIIEKYYMWIFLIIYTLNKTSQITQAMFNNSDRSLLTYDFYKEKEVVLNIYKERLKKLIIYNLLPTIVLSIFLIIILKLTLNISIFIMILIFILTTLTSITITNHYITLYYLIQPYDKDSRLINLKYAVINFIVLLGLLLITRIKISIFYLSIVVIITCLLYNIISIILVKKYSYKTFKIKY